MQARPVRAAFWTSDAGLLLYSTAPPQARKLPLVWVGKDGTPLGDAAPEGPYNAIAIRRDGERVALTHAATPRHRRAERRHLDLGLRARHQHAASRSAPKTDENPVWSPDGQRIAFSIEPRRQVLPALLEGLVGAGEEERLTVGEQHMDPLDWSPDGRFIVYRQMNPKTGWDPMLLPLHGDRKPSSCCRRPRATATPGSLPTANGWPTIR